MTCRRGSKVELREREEGKGIKGRKMRMCGGEEVLTPDRRR